MKKLLFILVAVLSCVAFISCKETTEKDYQELAKKGTKATVEEVMDLGLVFNNGRSSCIKLTDGSGVFCKNEKIAGLGIKSGTKIIFEKYDKADNVKLIMVDPENAPQAPVAVQDSLIIEK